MISLVGGDLYQWDTGRIILVKPDNGTTVQEVHFTTKKMDYAYVAKTYKDGSSFYCAIPSILLQQYQDLYCYEVKENSDGEESISTSVFKITKRNRPVDYVYTEPEKFTYKQLEERVSKLEISLQSVQTSVDEAHDMVEEIKIDVDQSIKELNDSVSAVQNKVDESTSSFESSISEINDELTQTTALATEAKNSITEIATTANNASSVADEAKRIADEATSNIAGLRTIATNASTAAAEAKRAANEASSNVSEVRSIATNAQTGVNTTNQEVEKLKTSTADAKTTADEAHAIASELKTSAVKSVNGITPDDEGNVSIQAVLGDDFSKLENRVGTLETSVSELNASTSISIEKVKSSVSDLGTATSTSIDEIKKSISELDTSTSSSIEEVKASIAGVKTTSDSTSAAVSELQNTVVKSVNGNLPDNSGNVSIQAVLGDDFTKLENRVNTFEGTLESTRLTSEETATTVGELKEVLESVKTGQTELQIIVNEFKASLEEVKKNMVRTVNNVHPDTNGNVTISATSTDTPTTTQYNHFVEFGSESGTFGSGKYEECIEFTSSDGTTGSVDSDNDGGSIEF